MTQEALKMALPLLEDCVNSYGMKYERPAFVKAITAIKEALAQPEQEPVACDCNQGEVCHICDPIISPQRTEPPDWFPAVENILKEYGLQAMDFVADFKEAMKDAEQSQRTWVGLTYEEKSEMWRISRAALPRYATYATLIETNLKEKNT